MVLTVYHDLNDATIGDQCLIQIKTWSDTLYHIKTEVATDVTDCKDVTDFDNEQKCYCILTQATIKYVFLRDKKVILLSFMYEQPKPVS